MKETTGKTRVTIQMDQDLKEAAARLFEDLGINMTSAVNVFLRKAVEENGIPFPVASVSSRRKGREEYAEKTGPAFRLEEPTFEPAPAWQPPAFAETERPEPPKPEPDPITVAAFSVPARKPAPDLSCPRMEIQKRLVRIPARKK